MAAQKKNAPQAYGAESIKVLEGLEAVRRSMASQGFQGSGNMMAALQKYGGDFYNQYVGQRLASQQAQSGPVSGGMSSLALLASGLGGFYGR